MLRFRTFHIIVRLRTFVKRAEKNQQKRQKKSAQRRKACAFLAKYSGGWGRRGDGSGQVACSKQCLKPDTGVQGAESWLWPTLGPWQGFGGGAPKVLPLTLPYRGRRINSQREAAPGSYPLSSTEAPFRAAKQPEQRESRAADWPSDTWRP